MSITVMLIVISAPGTIPKCLERGLEELVIGGPNRDHPNYIMVKISQNTEKSSKDLMRLAATPDSNERPSVKAGDKTSQDVLREIINNLVYMNDIKLFCQK